MAERKRIEIKPQPGKQEQFLSSSADIAIYGGGAFSGKTFAELLEPLRHIQNPKFSCVIFRRTSPQITNPGALWDEAANIYPLCGGVPYESLPKHYTFPSGAQVGFHHLQYDTTVYDWQGSQICLIEFDELTHFSEKQFFYMLSRNRSDCGVNAYTRATCNPDADSWVARFIQWWWDRDTGLPIEERCGVLRWFVRLNDEMFWADSKQELFERFGQEDGADAKSVTFISADIFDNPIGMAMNPGYLANLKALPFVERSRLLGKNWLIRASGGNIFKFHWFNYVNALPNDVESWVRYWDLGGSDSDTSDFTVGLLMGKAKGENKFYVADIQRGQWSSADRNLKIKQTCQEDAKKYKNVKTYLEITFGLAVDVTKDIITSCSGYDIRRHKPQGAKASRASLISAQCEVGNVFLLRALWNNNFTDECIAFSEDEKEYEKDDQVDAFSGAYNRILRLSSNVADKQPSFTPLTRKFR